MKICICIGGLSYRIHCRFSQVPEKFKGYLCEDTAQCVDIAVTDEDVRSERKNVRENSYDCEQAAILRKIAYHALRHDRLLIHGACISYEGKGYLFLAPSGTGKTTHVNLWEKMLGERVTVVNGDKPILALGDEIRAFGTPWNGKEGLGNPISVPLAAIAEIRQADENLIMPMKKADAFSCLYRQSFLMGADSEIQKKLISAAMTVAERVPVYLLRCNMDETAFTCSFETLTGEKQG